MSDLERYARRLREEPGFSRNRRFDELSSPEAVHLRHRLRRLAGIARELSTARSVTLRPEGEGYLLVLDFPAVRARRQTWLTLDEHALLEREGHLPAAAATSAAEATSLPAPEVPNEPEPDSPAEPPAPVEPAPPTPPDTPI